MANNRLWAVCKHDNEAVVLLKNYSDWYHVGVEDDHNEFFIKHKDCPGNRGCGENIVFVTEIDDDRVIMFDFMNTEKIEMDGELMEVRKTKVYLKGDEEKPAPKKFLANK